VNSECYICENDDEVTNFPHFYVNGSEGCNLCLQCRISLTETIRDMRSAVTRAKIKHIKKEKMNGVRRMGRIEEK
jgi:hypothetical protein